jgi:hypothetical protein|tara:strand:+ start:2851 stop:3483 length:633 start_codon:yes stop_codon:yes gene_type:complete
MFGNTQQNGALNLGAQAGSSQMGASMNPFANSASPMMQQTQQNQFMGSMMGGMGMQPGMMQQPMTPPSEMDIQLAMMRTLAPIDRFVIGAQMATMLQMLNDLVSFSILEILKNAEFIINEEEGKMKMDITSLPTNLQTMSAENVTGQFNSLQMASQQNIQNAEMQQQQIAAFAQQSMMGGALGAALANDGFMDKAGGAAGNFMGRMMGTR